MKTAATFLLTLGAILQLRTQNTFLRWRLRGLRKRAARVAVRRAFDETKHLPPCLR